MASSSNDFFVNKDTFENVAAEKIGKVSSKGVGKEDGLNRFWRTFRELHPIVVRSFSDVGFKELDIHEFKDQITQNISYYRYVTDSVIRAFGFSSYYELSDSQRQNLSYQVASLLKEVGPDIDEKFFVEAIKVINDQAQKNTVLKDISTTNKDIFVSEDIMVNLKINCLGPSVQFSNLLDALGCSIKKKSSVLKLQQDIAVRMAKDMCFNQEPDATLWDRESAFISLIGPCMRSVMQAWINVFCYQLSDQSIVSKDYDYLLGKLSETKKAISDKDMGHEDFEYVLRFFSEKASSFLVDFTGYGFTVSQNQIIWGYIWSRVDLIIAQHWHSVCDSIINYVSSLTEEQQQKWMENEGSNPLNPSRVWMDAVDSISSGISLSHICNKVKKDLVARDAASFLTLSWGVSNALCRYKESY